MTESQTILIVEDNELNMKMANILLKQAGYQVIEAYNAVEGIQLATERQPDIILMDMHMPGKSGYDASKQLTTQSETRHIPIIAFTARAMDDEQQEALAHGCIGLITKPIDVATFSQTVASYMQHSSQSVC